MNNNSWASKNSMRGLSNFIQDIRRSRGKEAEQKRVNKELANIRKNFAENSNLNGYKKKKYVCKLLYIYTLGYEVDFGFMEAINLLKSTKYTEKQTGYLAIGILLHEDHSMIPLLVQALADDLGARSEYAQCLALSTIANIGGKQMAEAQLAPAATKLLLAKTSPNNVKKKAALCLLQLHRKYSDFISADQWADRIVQLMQLKDLGVVSSLMSLLLAVAQKEPEGYEGCVDTVIELLGKIVLDKDYPREYLYYNVPNPWLQVKMLRFLRQYPPTPNQKTLRRLHDVLKRILSYGEKGNIKTQPSANHRNAINCVMFEAIDLIIHYDSDASLIRTAAELVARFLGVKDTNVKYLVLEAMAHLSAMADKQTSSLIRSHHETVIRCLRDADISIRRRALDLLYAMCDRSNSKRIVAELLAYLADAEFDIREELVLKIAILAEKFASNYAWYVDTILTLISTAPDDVPDDIWFRVVQIVTNHDDIQEYACVTALKALRQSSSHQTTVKVAGYLLGEFGHLIDNKPGSGPAEQFEALHSKFHSSSAATKAVLLSGYAKMLNLYPDELGPKIMDVFRQLSTTVDAEIQQRACEYYNLARLGNPDLMQSVLDVMPAFQLHEGEEELEEEGASHEEVHHHHHHQQEYDSGSDDEKYDAEKESPRSPQQQPHSFAAVDDSLQHFTAPSAPAPSSVSNPTYGGIGGEIFGVTSSPVRSPAAPVENVDTVPDVVPVKSKPTEQGLMQLFRLLCVRSDGLLYEDATIQIGIKSEYSKGVGRVMLYYGNTSNSTITQFNVVIAPVNYLSIQVQENPPTIGPLRQESQLLNVACISEFQDALSMQVAFLANGKSEILSLRLPIVLTKFVEPLIFSGQDFFAEWKKYSGPPCEHQSIFKASQAIDLSAITNILSNGFRFAVLPEVDPNKNNLVAAGTLYTSNKLTPVLLRLETNPEANMIRLTIRSSSGQVTASIKTLVSAQLMS